MPWSSVRRLALLGTFPLIAVAPVAACGGEPVSPLPVRSPPASGTGTPSGSGAGTPSQTAPPTSGVAMPPVHAPPSRRNPPVERSSSQPQTTPPTAQTPSCMGAIRYDVDLQNTELALLPSLCFAVGAVLRLQGIGPGLVTVEPTSLHSQSYAGGVVDIRFIRTGTATVTIPQEEQTHTITVVIR
ncbi:hypothetical protein WEI85_16445 [Actinomycetes bacterium KLBMP 9797]